MERYVHYGPGNPASGGPDDRVDRIHRRKMRDAINNEFLDDAESAEDALAREDAVDLHRLIARIGRSGQASGGDENDRRI